MSDRVFISYASKHPIYAEIVITHLSDKFSFWIDKNDLLPGQAWGESLIEGIINDCFALIVIITKEAVASPIVRVEVSTALANNKLVIPIIMESKLNIDKCLRKINPELATKHAINFVQYGFETSIRKLNSQLAKEADTWAKLQNTISRLDHFSGIVRQNAVELLSRTGDPRVIAQLISAMWIEPNWYFRTGVYVPALGRFRDNPYAFSAIFNVLENWHQAEGLASGLEIEPVCKALGLCGEGQTEEQLDMFFMRLASLPPLKQLTIARLIAACRFNEELEKLAFGLFIAFLTQDDERRLGALYSLGTMGNKDVIKNILPCLLIDDVKIHQAVEKALKQLGYPDFIPSEVK